MVRDPVGGQRDLSWLSRLPRLIGLSVAIVAGVAVLWWLRMILLPFVVAVAITYVLEPVVTLVQNRGRASRQVSVAIVYLSLAGLLIVAGVFVVPVLLTEAQALGQAMPDLVRDLERLVEQGLVRVRGSVGPALFAGPISDALRALDELSRRLATTVVLSVPGVLSGLVLLFLSPFLAYYMLRDATSFRASLRRLLPDRHREDIIGVLRDIDRAVAGYVRAQLIVAGVVALLASAGLLILGVRFALVLGLVAGVFEVVPYFGPALGAVPAVLVAAVDSPALAVKVIVLFVIIQQLDAVLVSPRIIGQGVGLHPLAVVFVLLVGGRVLGLVGVLLAVPVTVVGRVVVLRLREETSARPRR